MNTGVLLWHKIEIHNGVWFKNLNYGNVLIRIPVMIYDTSKNAEAMKHLIERVVYNKFILLKWPRGGDENKNFRWYHYPYYWMSIIQLTQSEYEFYRTNFINKRGI